MSQQLNNRYYETGDTIRVKTLGVSATDAAANTWILNAATTYKVEEIEKINSQNYRYKVTLDNPHIFRIGDTITITGSNYKGSSKVYSVNSATQVTIGDQGNIDSVTAASLRIRKNIGKGNATNYDIDHIAANVQNVYKKGTSTLVASSSIPNFWGDELGLKNTQIKFSGTFPPTGTAKTDTFKIISSGDHGFYTGQAVYYKPQVTTTTRTDIDGNTITTEVTQTGIADEGIYFVKRLPDTTTIKLAQSKSQLFEEDYVETEPITVTDNTIELFVNRDKTLDNQKLFREIPGQNNDLNATVTEPGTKNAILLNGVEVLNYKSLDGLNYGRLESISVDNSGSGYDVITPPNLVISDNTGVGATANAIVSGSFQRIDLEYGGFDYLEDPVIEISGGNGKGARAFANTGLVEHIANFGSAEVDGLVTIASTSAIGFSTYHKFRNYEKVIYKSNDQPGIVGLTTGAYYYVNVQNSTNVKLHNTIDDAVAGINTVTFTGYGEGRHSLQATDLKRVVSSIEIQSPGTGYQNRKTTVVGLSTALNEIAIVSHGYSSGEKIRYIADSTPIGGLTNGTEYYVTVLDEDHIKLSAAGPESDRELFYRTKQYVDVTTPFLLDRSQIQLDPQEGKHHFNYPAITATVVGKIGISSVGSETFQARVSPIVRGNIEAVNLAKRGVGYGSSEVLNYIREPEITIQVGSDVQLTPIVSNGKVVQVIVQNGGKNINTLPKLNVVSDSGQGCVLTPVISGGRVSSVNVIGGGFGYEIGDVSIEVVYPGSGASLRTQIQRWTVNEYQRNVSNITSDDTFLDVGLNEEYGLQGVNLYAPRNLRKLVYQNAQDGTVLYNSPDLALDNGVEKITSKNHSPIIGWAYDGNPIYGPFGYLKKNGGVVAQMKSGYKLNLQNNRPPTSEFPEGFFVEDYEHISSSSEDVLDENNGRFCITPEFPKGTYAYFTSLSDVPETQGIFKGFKTPQFPYLVGKCLYSKPANLNYLKSSNHDDYMVDEYNWIRNTKYYNLEETDSSYSYIERPFKMVNNQLSKVTFASPGGITDVGILTGGTNYKVNDALVLEDVDVRGFNAQIVVSKVGGKQVSNISCATTSIDSIEVLPTGKTGEYLFYADSPHGLLNQELVSISGLSTTAVSLSGEYNIGVTTSTLVLRAGVGTTGATGLTTYFDIYGVGIDNIKENDVFKVEDEKVKVLNIDKISSRIRVLREVLGTSGAAHTATTIFYEEPRKFTANVGFNTTFDFVINKELYFEPQNTLALGMSAGVGIGTTITFVNPGSGATNVFLPTQTLYLPSHGLKTGDELIYRLNSQDEGIGVSTAGVSTFALADQQKLFVAKISEDQIGVSTIRVGLNSTGTFAGIGSTNAHQGLLFFTGYGQGANHSFVTNYPNVISVSQFKNTVTVSTASTHGLTVLDNVYVDVRPSITTSFAVSYNDYNQRIIIDKKDVAAGSIDVTSNEITIPDHGYQSGQSLIYTASSPAGGLSNETIYYAVIVNKDKIKLSESQFSAVSAVPTIVDITSATDSSFSPINPPIKVYKDSTVEFDLSDSSLTYTRNSISYPAFKFVLYTDSNFDTEFDKTTKDEDFEVLTTGTVGVDGKVTLKTNSKIPKTLFYKLTPISEDQLPTSKKNVVCDPEVIGYNQLEVLDSQYSGKQIVSISSPTSFRYDIKSVPETLSYTSSTAIINYSTDSSTGIGSVAELKITNPGANYYTLPSIESVTSGIGSNAVFQIGSTDIGAIKKTKLRDIGFDYPFDKTLKPAAKLPEIVKINSLAILDAVGVTSYGYGYGSIEPKVILLDGETGDLKEEVDLRFSFGSNQLQIVSNTFGINPVTPTLLPTNNTNGMGIGTITYDSSSKDVTITLSSGITTVGAFPFAVGDEIMIESTSVGIASTNPQGVVEIVDTGKGYNTKDYNYKLFVVSAVQENIGGIGIVTFSLDGYLPTGEAPGTFSPTRSAGRIIPKKHFPTFDVTLTTTDFVVGEDLITLENEKDTGVVERWNPQNGYLKIDTFRNFTIGNTVEGQSSRTRGIIASIISSDSEYDLESTSRVESGWEDITGFLNDTRQVIQDSDYYQRFSYSVRSKVDLETWDEVVGSLNHTSGFKRFSDLIIENTPDINPVVGLGTTQSHFSQVIDFISYPDVHCYDNFDIVTENNKGLFSDKIFFKNRILTDYEESIGNRVLNVDNVSGQFNSNPRATKFSEVARWPIADACGHKFVTYIQDTDVTAESQIQMVTILHDKQGAGFINQYAITSTEVELGSFDYTLDGTEGVLQFFPNKFEINPYNVFTLSYNIGAAVTSTDTQTLGGAVKITSSSQNVSIGTTTNIVSIANTYTAAKVLVLTKTVDNQFEYDELNIISDGTTVDLVEYGELSSINQEAWSGGYSGLGTYNAYIDGSNIKVDFAPNVSVASSVNTIIVGLSSAGTGIGSEGLNDAEIGALPTSIASSGSPTANAIAEYDNDTYNAAYCIVQVSDPDNDHHMMTELLVIDKPDFNETYISEFGTVVSDTAPAAGLGTFGAAVVGDVVRITFTPNENIHTEVKTYYNYMKFVDDGSAPVKIDFTNAYIDTQYGSYAGTDVDIKRAFNILYGGYQVFERYIDASDGDVVGSSAGLEVPNAITIPNHFFVSGEQLTYSTPGAGTTENISIGTTTISGVSTDKLPGTVFAIKVDANKIRLTDTAEKALAAVPNDYFDIASVGIGTSHTFTATDQNTKCLISIDNYIQSPVVATALTTSLSDQLFSSQGSMFLSGIGSISGGDLLQIDDEIMKVESVGVGSTNQVRIRRAWLGTRRAGYSTGALVTKVQGNYNIVNNTLNFVEAPFGNIPIGSTTNPPNERDWTGITTSSTFQGRVFIRSGTPGSTTKTYGTNYIFDDVSDQFNGTNDTFALKSSGSDVTGFENDNAVLLINDIIQVPGLNQNFTLAQQAGITSAVFVNDGQNITYDVNSSNLPIGGVIVSVGSSEGFGYQPRVSAGGTATVSAAGTISAISIGNTGSGYRAAESYDVLTSVATTVAVGATIITINDQNSVFKYLEFNAGAASSIGVGSFFSRPTPIISVGTTSVNIGIGSTASSEIPAGTSVLVRVFNPSVGIVRVGVASSAVGIQTVTHIGVATISAGNLLDTVHVTSVGSGYTSSDLPEVIIEDPLAYVNIPLIYQTDGLFESSTGVGTQAKVNINVGFGSDVTDFEISNTGFGYGRNQNLTIPTGGPTGIPTNPTLGGDFERFTINVEKIYSDKFAGWSLGQLQTIDNFDDEFDGQKTDFQLKIDGTITSIIASKGSPIVVQDVLIVLVNNILQVPGEGYTFNGGSTIIFPEPLVPGDTVNILFYKGNGSVDVKSVDILETVKEGDTLDINIDPLANQSSYFDEEQRLVYSVDSTDQVTTNAYYGPGLANDINLERPVTWCKQTVDKVVNGERVAKDRTQYRANVFPTTNVIQTVGVGSTTIYVENVQVLFNQDNESATSLAFQKDVTLVSQDARVGAAATAVVGSAGTITSIVISDGGSGYSSAPAVIIENPVGLGTTMRQTATASITAGVVTSITLGTAKTGYSQSNPPVVLIESPALLAERLNAGITYSGDFGTIVGVTTTTVGVATGLVFELFIPNNSALKDATLVGTAITVSSLAAGDFFTVNNSNIGLGVTSLKPGGAVAVGVGTTCIDNVYEVVSATTAQKTLPGVGSTTINKVTVSVLSYNGYDFSAVGVNTYFGNYSFGKIQTTGRTSTSAFNFYNSNGVTGIQTSAVVRRTIPLKISNYDV